MADQKFFPTVPSSHWNNLRVQFKKTIPGTISSNYLASVLGMTETSAKANILPSLRQIGLIDTENKTNQDLARRFRDDNAYPELCKEIINKLYPQELRDAFPDKDSNKDQIKTWIMNHTGNGDSAANKIASFYITLLDADINTISKVNTITKNKDEKPKVAKAKEDKHTPSPSNEKKHKDDSFEEKESNGPDLNINIQIHISSDASPDQIKSIFENMAKYVYKR